MGTYMQGAQSAGSTPTPSRDVGLATFSQTINIQAAGTANLDVTAYLPDGAQILDWNLDTTVLHTSATATLQAGTTVGGVDIFSATNVLAAGRAAPTLTAAQLILAQAMPHVSGQSDSPVYFRLVLTTPTSVGTTKVNIRYAVKLS